nr:MULTISPECIES: hypothetical protein [unclassified Streptomyces]
MSMLLTALAAMVLLALVLPRQEKILEGLGGTAVSTGTGAAAGTGTVTDAGPAATARHAMFTGVFNLL